MHNGYTRTRNMHIAYVTDQMLPQTGTATRQTVNMAAAFGAAGAQVTLVAPKRWLRDDGTTARDVADYFEVDPNFEIVTTRSAYPNIRGIEKLGHGLRAPLHPVVKEADLVYTRMLPVVVGALLAGQSVVYETYRPWPDQQLLSRPFFRWLGRRSLFLGAVLHSHLAASSYLAAGVASEKLLVAHNGYAPSILQPALSRKEARRQCELPAEGPIVTYTGRINRQKGFELVLRIAATRPDVLFVLVGSEGHGYVEREAEKLENVRLVRWMATGETTPYLYAADILLIPPVSGPLHKVGNTVLPMKTFLYMAAGRAILAPQTPDLEELLHNNSNAVLVAPDDLHAAVGGLDRMLEDTALRERLGRQAELDVADSTWSRRAARILRFIEKRRS